MRTPALYVRTVDLSGSGLMEARLIRGLLLGVITWPKPYLGTTRERCTFIEIILSLAMFVHFSESINKVAEVMPDLNCLGDCSMQIVPHSDTNFIHNCYYWPLESPVKGLLI